MLHLIQRKRHLRFACFLWAFVLVILALRPAKEMHFFFREEWMTNVLHAITYGSMAFLLVLYFRFKRNLFGIHLKPWSIALMALLLTSGWGVVTELLQHFTPDRTVDFWDWVWDTGGGMAGILSFYLFRRWL